MKSARDAKGWTQDELAERLKVSRGTVWRWESGTGAPLIPDQFNDLIGALGMSAEESLRQLGVKLYPPAFTKLPRDLIDDLVTLPPDQIEALRGVVHAMALSASRNEL